MRMYDVIDKKKKGSKLTGEEIRFAVEGYVKKEIPDYQMAALLMAIYYQGMDDEELLELTNCMAESGDRVDLSGIQGIKVDKHSTGGVGDKTTLAVAPLVAACGGKVAKMSGRGLGFTGGTVDKLESIPGMELGLSQDKFFRIVNETGLSIISQSAEIAPADKKLYALRDVTATVDSIPLIAASVMSKKLAAGSDKIILDVTVGSGAFMKTREDAIQLAQKMVAIGEGAGRQTVAFLTNMDVPLGVAVGNDIEVIEAIHTLQGKGPEDFQEICLLFASHMLYMGGRGSLEECKAQAREAMENGRALEKLVQMVDNQGGDSSYITSPEKFSPAPFQQEITAWEDGYITGMDTERCGRAAVILGAGRETKDSRIDAAAGIRFWHKTGDSVKTGDPVATLYASDKKKLEEGTEYLKKAYTFGKERVEPMPSVLAFVSKDGVVDMGTNLQ